MISKLVKWSEQTARRIRFRALVTRGLPAVIVPPVRFLLEDKIDDPAIVTLRDKVEAMRAKVAAKGHAPVDILYSPKPGSSGTEVTPSLRPSHGEVLSFTMRQAARTGKDRRWGTFLHLCARSSRAGTILELGSCIGISGCYLAGSPYCGSFMTVEGSTSLASIAEENLAQISDKAVVYNMLFDEALDVILPRVERIDLAFVDGHHEKVATIHYFKRIEPKLAPGALVVFDDISWSYDMRECWAYLAADDSFSDAVDLGLVGVCLWNPSAGPSPRYWDLQKILGKQPVGHPHGWHE